MRIKSMLAIAALLLLLMVPPASSAQAFPKNPMNWVMAKRLTVDTISTLTGAVTTGGSVVVGDDLTTTDDLNVTDDAIFGSDISASPQTTITVTMNGWITPTGSLTLLSSAGTVALSGGHLAPGTAGDVLILLNTGSNTITISETTGLISAGNIALGTLDSATLVWRLANWYQIAASNN